MSRFYKSIQFLKATTNFLSSCRKLAQHFKHVVLHVVLPVCLSLFLVFPSLVEDDCTCLSHNKGDRHLMSAYVTEQMAPQISVARSLPIKREMHFEYTTHKDCQSIYLNSCLSISLCFMYTQPIVIWWIEVSMFPVLSICYANLNKSYNCYT